MNFVGNKIGGKFSKPKEVIVNKKSEGIEGNTSWGLLKGNVVNVVGKKDRYAIFPPMDYFLESEH